MIAAATAHFARAPVVSTTGLLMAPVQAAPGVLRDARDDDGNVAPPTRSSDNDKLNGGDRDDRVHGTDGADRGCPVVVRQIGEAEHSEADHDATFHREPLVDLGELSLELGRAAA